MSIKATKRAISPECFLGLALTLCFIGSVAILPRFSRVAAAAQAANGDAKRGHDLFQRRCTSCHNLDTEKEGPRLRGVFGRKAGSIQSFNYSDALKKANIIWNAESLDQWLADTDKFIPDNDMNQSFRDGSERADIIAYLKQLSSQ